MKKLLIIGFTWPEPDSTAAGQRMMQLLEVFLEEKYQLTFATTAQKTEYSIDLTALGINERQITLNSSGFDDFVKDLHPDLVLFDRFLTEEQFGWRVAGNVPNALRILDTEDLHSLRHVREKTLKNRKPFTYDAWLGDDKTLRELASIFRSDLSLIISSHEMKVLRQKTLVPASLLLHLPFMVDTLPNTPKGPGFEGRKDFIFIGGGRHTPNLDAIHQLRTSIWPLIRKELPKAHLTVYGAYLPREIMEMHQPQYRFLVKGRAKDLKTLMEKARVFLAPLRFGAGIKGKLLNAMQYGLPSVTTTIGAEGMRGNLSWGGAIADSPEDFANSAIQLYRDHAKWENAQKAGIVLVNAFYGKEPLKQRLLKGIEGLNQSLDKHRQANIMGRMLQHHTLQSTKYLGKWIEAKNEKRGEID